MVPASLSMTMGIQRSSAEESAPTRMAICCREGVAPTRYPVLRSCEVVPPLEMAMQAMAAMERAAILYGAVVQPSEKKMSEVMRSVATVIPLIGFDELPTSPVSRELTVTKRNPRTRMRIAPRMLILSEGASVQATTSASEPAPTTQRGRSRSVRGMRTREPPTHDQPLLIPQRGRPGPGGGDLTRALIARA